jgi:uncharacterized protein YyaL (SSP411 family)
MTGGGGWPMSVFLAPDGRPFYGGTYFPDEPRHGMPSFRQVLEGVNRAWREDRANVEAAGGRLVQALVDQGRVEASGNAPDEALLEAATASIEGSFDPVNGGWGRAPKFPQPMTIEYLLRRHLATGDARPLAIARRTLDAMADGGIHDQLGGGFHRYSTDAEWLVPHFEQMLYDNAQLARVYVHAWHVTGDRRYFEVATGTLNYLIREMTTEDGAFAASQDADTQGKEGATFVWTGDEIRDVLGDDAVAFGPAFDVTDAGNWEGRTILRRVSPRGSDQTESQLADARERLLVRRQQRAQPARDDKALAAWNGLAIAAFADAAVALEAEDGAAASRYRAAAVRAAEAITRGLIGPDGVLGRSWKDGRASGTGVLEDYTHLAEGLLALYEATFEERWFATARALMDHVLAHFGDPAGGFFDTSDAHERLVTRPRDVQDNAVPSGNAMAAVVLLRLAAWTGAGAYRDAAERGMRTVVGYVTRYPTGFAQWLVAMDMAIHQIVEVAIVGEPEEAGTRQLLAEVRRPWDPWRVVAASADPARSVVPLLEGRISIDGKSTAYACRGFVCRLPVVTASALRRELTTDESLEPAGRAPLVGG